MVMQEVQLTLDFGDYAPERGAGSATGNPAGHDNQEKAGDPADPGSPEDKERW